MTGAVTGRDGDSDGAMSTCADWVMSWNVVRVVSDPENCPLFLLSICKMCRNAPPCLKIVLIVIKSSF